jgi:hypothetical protein
MYTVYIDLQAVHVYMPVASGSEWDLLTGNEDDKLSPRSQTPQQEIESLQPPYPEQVQKLIYLF